ncbi:MAG: GNAT family N-acetyltransferase [Oscillochloris sp.]|nr:GNAT family N-acetyltransferase [Oscillochloris sp.]
MSDHKLTLTEVELREITDEDCAAYWVLSEAVRAEHLPDDPPITYEMFAGRCRSVPSFFTMRALFVRPAPGEPMIAAATVGFDISGENAHLAQFSVEVVAAQRRRGLGRTLLAWVAHATRENGRRSLITSTNSPVGEIFMRRIGAHPGLENRQSQLALADLDRSLLARWQADADEAGSAFELLFWDNHYPEEYLHAFASLGEVMNTAPRGDLEIEDHKITPERIHERVASIWARGDFFWTIVAREIASGQMVGFTEIFGNPASPSILYQGATAVCPEYRGQHLGRWMKAAMLDLILSDLPAARFIRTGNAVNNAPMLTINAELGFKPYLVSIVWQIDVEQVLAYAER